jgi:hypothetical protein
MDRVYVALAALAGGLFSALMGWMASDDPFDARKFGGSAIRTLIAAIIFAVGYQFTHTTVTVLDLFYAFLGGAGVDAIGNRIAAKFGNGSFPLSNSPETPNEGKR